MAVFHQSRRIGISDVTDRSSFCLDAFKRQTVGFQNDLGNGGSGEPDFTGNDTFIGELPDIGDVAFLGNGNLEDPGVQGHEVAYFVVFFLKLSLSVKCIVCRVSV